MKKCFVCQKEFKNEIVLRQHHSDTSCGQSSKCWKCQKECGTISARNRHLEEDHPKGSGAAFAGGGTAAPQHYSNTSRGQSMRWDEEFPPLPKTKSLSKPVITVKTGSHLEAAMRAKKEHEAERSRQEMLKVQRQTAQKAHSWQPSHLVTSNSHHIVPFASACDWDDDSESHYERMNYERKQVS